MHVAHWHGLWRETANQGIFDINLHIRLALGERKEARNGGKSFIKKLKAIKAEKNL